MGKRSILLITIALLITFLTSCTSIDSEPYGKEEVLLAVSAQVPTEAYELVAVNTVSEKPKNMAYTFRSKERDLTFTANSTLTPVGIDATDTAFYHKEITCSYVQEIHKLYAERVRTALAQYDVYDSRHEWFSLLCFDDIDEAAKALYAASQIYAEELSYNNADFLKENPVTMIHAAWFPAPSAVENHDDWINVRNIDIDGVSTEQEYYDALAHAYGAKVFGEEIADDSAIPEEYLHAASKE